MDGIVEGAGEDLARRSEARREDADARAGDEAHAGEVHHDERAVLLDLHLGC